MCACDARRSRTPLGSVPVETELMTVRKPFNCSGASDIGSSMEYTTTLPDRVGDVKIFVGKHFADTVCPQAWLC